ncbi:SusD/RagB family nutrient-binding outer membrane lipoprotein [Elizabethkingia anophelis]|uniref:SusD/RagB family nutrient-binding outer membrane lipoprotein n=1 Tax=Elizabethkingia anophelis NUHP1 TaxID=1338011 RepID=A0A077EFP2_9FLAO|nr:SusD/RagB family nutrient-binding outer membrane lipoprotein [Elizabethkingia anophelis]AIL44340.1 hypothetical protein BD94_0565 [Elizabethkingia anophelis NUHP1]EQB92748.1 hypothetical protein C874_18560 [Elizabethkingia anophelis 502]MBE9394795.1 SusD/RagB family nutrient-binding outer membrane lipoprotein [Elizabethkingia anophelis]MBE9406585.1 SusD/RagB family nutrient-binding outer membrane lipoprotein [Elizabethkingia anophelis]MCT3648038.1 SusD/RagB family nutrient-binding outer mem
MKKYILLSLLSAVVVSCSLDDNIDPNKVVAEKVKPELRLSGASTTAYAVQAGDMNKIGNAWTNSWSGNFAQFGNPYTVESDLEIYTSFNQNMFRDSYQAITRFQRIIDFGAEYPNYVAIAKIQKAYYMQYVVDLYGSVPYSEAFKESDNATPKYDKDVDVYKGLADELMSARTLIDANGSNAKFQVAAFSDPIFQGDMKKWKEFANTVLLKLAVRLSNTTNADGIALRNQIINSLSGASFISYDVKINPGYNGGSSAGQSPLYYNFGQESADGSINTGGYQLMTASDHAINMLQGSASKITSGVSDPRIGFLFTKGTRYNNGGTPPGPLGYYGWPQGMNVEDYKVFMGYPVDAKIKPANANFSFLGGDFALSSDKGSAIDGIIMMRSESEFLQSEAALRGYPGFGSDQGHFEAGIKASFTFDRLPGDAAAYIANISGKTKVGWTGAQNDKIAAIQYQRWVALMNYNGIESYINYLRTGYPETPLAKTTVKANKPWRMLYPATEYSNNSANTPKVSQDQCFIKNEFTPFIYK